MGRRARKQHLIMSNLLKELIEVVAHDYDGRGPVKVRKVGSFLFFLGCDGPIKVLKADDFLDGQSWPYNNDTVYLRYVKTHFLCVGGKLVQLSKLVEVPEMIKPRARTPVPKGYQEGELIVNFICPHGLTGEVEYYTLRVFIKKDLELVECE